MGFLEGIKNQSASTPAAISSTGVPRGTAVKVGNNPYAGMGAQELSKKRNYLLRGRHVLKVIQCNDGSMPAAKGGRFFFGVDFAVVESTNPDMAEGQERSWITQLGKFPEYFLKDVKGFLAAAAKADPSLISDEAAGEATAQGNPLQGRLLVADTTATNKVNPDTGEAYLQTRFSILPE